MPSTGNSILLAEYTRRVKRTDRLPKHEVTPVLLDLFGEVGSIMATAKKLHREKKAFAGYKQATIEEFGDALWYLAALCRRLKVPLDNLFAALLEGAGLVILAMELAWIATDLPRMLPRALLGIAGFSIFWGMTLALFYAAFEYAKPSQVGIPVMAWSHGILNGFGFATCGLLGARAWRAG